MGGNRGLSFLAAAIRFSILRETRGRKQVRESVFLEERPPSPALPWGQGLPEDTGNLRGKIAALFPPSPAPQRNFTHSQDVRSVDL